MQYKLIFIVFVTGAYGAINVREGSFSQNDDYHLTVTEIITKYGYPVETHIVLSDNYILTIHRIPYGKKSGPAENKPIAFLQHGVLSSSADWIIAGTENGLGYILADEGYDVWMGNARGNKLSRNHTSLNPDVDKKAFWDFSWHEIGVSDIPNMIDYVLGHTGQDSLFHIGHSQGTTTFYVMCSERPEYNAKIKAHFSLAPIAYMNHISSFLLQSIAVAEGGINFIVSLIGMYEFLPSNDFLAQFSEIFCSDGSITQALCTNALFIICGFSQEQMNTTLLPIIMGHTPAGASTKQIMHHAQLINSGKFQKWDYGVLGNREHYGSVGPPDYDLSRITAPIYFLYSRSDWLSAEVDVLKAYKRLPNVQGKFLNADPKWNHLDYMYGIDAKKNVYNYVISLMSRYWI